MNKIVEATNMGIALARELLLTVPDSAIDRAELFEVMLVKVHMLSKFISDTFAKEPDCVIADKLWTYFTEVQVLSDKEIKQLKKNKKRLEKQLA